MQKEFFINLERQLNDHHDWPNVYMFKFIIPADNHKLAQVEALFGPEAIVTTRQSSSNKFISITAKEMMISADKVIDTYKKATKIEGIISL
ncbi:MAG: DUF493 family protein [Flavobacteriales bacterium]|nr:DUF493 family protein [Flavobacteriales bacterium]